MFFCDNSARNNDHTELFDCYNFLRIENGFVTSCSPLYAGLCGGDSGFDEGTRMKPTEQKAQTDFVPILAAFASSRADIRMLLVFGSRARGDYTEKSDIDIGILYENVPDLLAQGADASEIEYRTGYETDIVILNNLYNDWPEFAYNIVCEAKVLQVQTEKIWDEYRIRAYTSWFDFQDIAERSRKSLTERINNGNFGRPIHAAKN